MLLNVVYALLAERADKQDHTELLFSPHVEDTQRKEMARNREALDAWLSAPLGRLAAAESALVKELGGAA